MKAGAAGLFFAATVVVCVVIFCAAILGFGWNLFIRPILYAAGWVRPTAADLEIEGWKAERSGDTERAVSRYAEALRFDPTLSNVRERLHQLGADPDLVAPRPDAKSPTAGVAEAEPVDAIGPPAPASAVDADVHAVAAPPVHPREPGAYPPGWSTTRVYNLVVQRIESGATRREIADELAREGFTPEEGAVAVATAAKARVVALHEAGQKNMLYGALWVCGGLLVTAVTYLAAEGGGSFVLAWGAMLGGMIQFFRGTTQRAA